MSHSSSFAERLFKTSLLFPNRTAIYVDGRHYSYSEFSNGVLNLYDSLCKYNLQNTRIGITAYDNIETYTALFAIQLLNCAYLPLNIQFPDERISNILKQANVDCIINTGTKNLNLKNHENRIEIHFTKINCNSHTFNLNKLKSNTNDEICILFTSGTSSESKGVVFNKTGVNNMLDHFIKNETYVFTEHDRFLQVFDLSFDFSIFSFMIPISVGASCYILPQKSLRHFETIKMLEMHQISVVAMVPTVLRLLDKYLDEILLPHLRLSFFGGDALLHNMAVKWKKCSPNGSIVNVYGPTETTVICSTYLWNESLSDTESENGIVPIGKVFSDFEILIVDENNKRVKEGEVGEICFSGCQVLKSYLDSKHSKNKFLEISSENKNKRFYKTGDLARINKNKNLIFHGRIDRQVKLNGYRIELDELDFHLTQLSKKTAYSMLTQNLKTNQTQIISFLESNVLNEEQINEKLSTQIPMYMLPKRIVFLDAWPYNLNGKTDRVVLIEKWKEILKNE